MSSGQNLTVSLDKDVIRKARILAAKRGTSISKLVAEQIRAMITDDDRYTTAQLEALAHLEAGIALGGEISASRDELHER